MQVHTKLKESNENVLPYMLFWANFGELIYNNYSDLPFQCIDLKFIIEKKSSLDELFLA